MMRIAIGRLALDTGCRILSFLFCLSMSACVYVGGQAYPSAWPAQTNHGGCSLIAGTYADAGERIGANSFGFDSLSSAFGHYKSLPFPPPTDWVAISFGGDAVMNVKVGAKDRDAGAMQFSANAGEFKCQWGAIEISSSKSSAAEQVAGWEFDTILLSKASDGSLILKRSSSALGVTGGFIPIIATDTVSWSRFAIINSN